MLNNLSRKFSMSNKSSDDNLLNKLIDAIKYMGKCNSALSDFYQTGKLNIKSVAFIYENISILDKLFDDYQTTKKEFLERVFKEIYFQTYPDIFFSMRNLTNINVLKLISKGKFKKVFLVNLKSSNERVFAMKVREKFCDEHSKNLARSLEFYEYKAMELMEKEIGMLGKECRFLVETIATFDSRPYLFYMTEFMNGGSLAFHLEKLKQFEENQVKFYSAQISSAFLFLHEKNYINYVADIENILLDSNGNCKLSNFRNTLDFVKYSSYNKHIGINEHTISPHRYPEDEYSAPELLKSDGLFIEYSVDFWRLGIIAYKMLTGNFPFPDKISKISKEPKLDSLQISTEAKDFISELLIKEKFERLGSKRNNKKVKDHQFFNQINWHQLEHGQIKSPFKPSVASSVDTSNLNIAEVAPALNVEELTVDNNNFYDYQNELFEPITEYAVLSINLIKQIGHGGFGRVFYVNLKSSFESYAMKAIDKRLLVRNFKPPIDYKYLLNTLAIEKEVGLHGKNCRFLVKLINTCHSETHVFYFMEYLNGGSLDYHLETAKTFNEKTVAFYSAQMICAILFLQSIKIVHGDIKLGNILLDSNGHAKLGDFGTCIHLNENETKKCKVGSWNHMPPETFCTQNTNFSFDWWSLGVCIFHMSIGRLPFTEEKEVENYDNKFMFSKKERKKIDKLLGLIFKLLIKDPIERMKNSNNIQSDPFFSLHIDWDKLQKAEIEPPIKPNSIYFNGFSNFDSEDTKVKLERKLIGAERNRISIGNKKYYKSFDKNLDNIS